MHSNNLLNVLQVENHQPHPTAIPTPGTYVSLSAGGTCVPATIVSQEPLTARHFIISRGDLYIAMTDTFEIQAKDIKKVLEEPQIVPNGSRSFFYKFKNV